MAIRAPDHFEQGDHPRIALDDGDTPYGVAQRRIV
jgi:hypothetical protein